MESFKPLLAVSLLIAFALPACDAQDNASDIGMTEGKVIVPPGPCPAPSEPTCKLAEEYPTQLDLTTDNSSNVLVAGGGVSLFPGSGSIVDSDGDGVPDAADDCPGAPDWRAPCDGDPSNDGLYKTLFYDASGTVTLATDINVSATISRADAYILMDSSGSMRAEQTQLVNDLTTGTFLTPAEQADCPAGINRGLVGAMQCVVPDLWLGVGQFNDIPLLPHASPFDQSPYHHLLDVTDNIQYVSDAASRLVTTWNRDDPEAATQAIYSTVTGNGLGPWVPNRGACPSVPAGRWGYPCFRSGTLPIILLFTDEDMYNGPRPQSPIYAAPVDGRGRPETPFDPALAVGQPIPPVEQFPQVLYTNANDASILDLGNLTGKSVTVMGTNSAFTNDAQTHLVGTCQRSSFFSTWGDGKDAMVKFSLSAPTTVTISGDSTFYNKHNVAIADAAGNILDCDGGPGPSDYWGSLTMALPAGQYFAISDAALQPGDDADKTVGPFQLRIETTLADPSWQTVDAPVDWSVIRTAILGAGVKMVSVISEGDRGLIDTDGDNVGDTLAARPDAVELGILTDSVDQSGNPYVEEIAANGTGLTTALLDAVRSLVGDTRRDVSVVAEDNLATPGVDETRFVQQITPVTCPTTGISNCTGVAGNVCEGCLAGTVTSFQFRMGNDFVPQTGVDQVFEFDVVGLADGATELTRIPVRVMVPAAGTDFSAGHYETVYDSTTVCLGPPVQPDPERPDWGTLTVTSATPSDSSIEFVLTTADTVADLASATPVRVTVTTDGVDSFNVRDTLLGAGEQNWRFMLGVRANLIPSSGGNDSPLLAGWDIRFNCVDTE